MHICCCAFTAVVVKVLGVVSMHARAVLCLPPVSRCVLVRQCTQAVSAASKLCHWQHVRCSATAMLHYLPLLLLGAKFKMAASSMVHLQRATCASRCSACSRLAYLVDSESCDADNAIDMLGSTSCNTATVPVRAEAASLTQQQSGGSLCLLPE